MMQQDEAQSGGGGGSESFDSQELFERVDGDEELLREVLEIFLEDAPEVFSRLARGVEDKSPEDVAKAAHTLKGASANISASPVI